MGLDSLLRNRPWEMPDLTALARKDVRGPYIDDVGGDRVVYELDHVTHGVPVQLDPLLLLVPTEARARCASQRGFMQVTKLSRPRRNYR